MTERSRRAALAAVVLASIALYSASLRFAFTYDDVLSVVHHPGVHASRLGAELLLRDFWGSAFTDLSGPGTWRPLVTLSYWVDARLGRNLPWLFHASNLAYFALFIVAADRFLRTWASDRLSDTARLCTLAGFGALTIHVDVVPSITGRAEIFAALLSLIALERVCRDVLRPVDALVIVLAMLGAIASKESALTTPLIGVVMAAGRTTRPNRRRVAGMLILAIVVIGGSLALRGHLGLPIGPRALYGAELSNPLRVRPLVARLLGASEVFARYLEHAATGIDLCPDYSYATIVPATSMGLRAILGVAFVAFGGAWAWCSRRRDPRVLDAVLAFGASYAVISNVAFASSAILADRNFFFPSFWLLALVALGIGKIESRSRVAKLLVAVCVPLAIATQAIFTMFATFAWRDNRTLAVYALQTCPSNARMRFLLATDEDARDRTREAAWQVLVATSIVRSFPRALADDAFPLAWDALPIPARVERLRQQVGDAEAFRAMQILAVDLAGAEHMPNTAVLLTEWPTRVPTPDWLRERLEAIGRGSIAH
ncbi:MAG: hypothetical protein ACHREM_30160 [Polyangiales bacterium]